MFKAWMGALPRSLRRASPATQARMWEDTLRQLWIGQARNLSAQSSRGLTTSTLSSASRLGKTRPLPSAGRTAFHSQARRGFRFSPWRRNTGDGKVENMSMSAKFKKLSREYGKAAVAVYFGLSILDYPFFFLLVKAVGTERVARVEHFVVGVITSVIPEPVRIAIRGYWESAKVTMKRLWSKETTEKAEMVGWGVEEAQERHDEAASLGTQMALAYAIHKSFFFVRIPLTAAITPKVVKTLRSWGWNIGKPMRKGNKSA
ncbi:uncharacterized protein F5Z01DRAFT_673748 [Emericellopsis atlantica]|uniref:DUF1279 domain-containing protein n=1 Tax=Emericellopsis atlantica TaxID=2614577 RepID=A0A9P8CPJ2_9HYPO|nr:uncharacterized protein F5Z01DRAFT_673748 [Emericellopsis atlantica]KAG9254593.1 hypothetical protein F5Z01DRAFT_673748 [Emericellopsis atlantica]